MKRATSLLMISCCFLVACILCGCNLHVANEDTYIGAAEVTIAPAVELIDTPAPKETPRVESIDMKQTLFRRDGLVANVVHLTYTQLQQVDVTITVQNQSAQILTLYGRVPGAVNGWAVVFHLENVEDDATTSILPGDTETLRLFTKLDYATAEQMDLQVLQSVNLSFSGTLGEKGFVPTGNTIVNEQCEKDYIQAYGDEDRLIYQSARARYYYHAYDPLTATLYVSAETLQGASDIHAVARVNGYALGEPGTNVGFTENGRHVMLAMPLLETLRTFALNSASELQLSVLYDQKGQPVDADVFAVPVDEEALDAWQIALAVEDPLVKANGYVGKGLTFYGSDDIYIRHESMETESDAYYGTVTRYQLVCMNDTDAVLYPTALKILLAGAEVDGGFSGFIPPHSQTRLSFYICAHVPVGPEIGVELQLLDAAHKMKRVVLESITFLSYE